MKQQQRIKTMTTTERQYIPVADTAKLLRAELKANFPGTKFTVKSKSYAADY